MGEAVHGDLGTAVTAGVAVLEVRIAKQVRSLVGSISLKLSQK